MKKWILPLLAAVLTVSACGVLSGETHEEKVAREAREARMVVDNIQNGDFRIDIDRMYPIRGTSQHVSNYSVTVKDGMLDSHLPFIGQAWRVPYGGGHALNFKAKIGSYNVVQTRKDGYEVRIYGIQESVELIYRKQHLARHRNVIRKAFQQRSRGVELLLRKVRKPDAAPGVFAPVFHGIHRLPKGDAAAGLPRCRRE